VSKLVSNLNDFSGKILARKLNYTDYLYVKASQFLDSEDKFDPRLAYNNFVKLEKSIPSHKDVSNLKHCAYINAIDFAIDIDFAFIRFSLNRLLER
jgi:hypothetical protein